MDSDFVDLALSPKEEDGKMPSMPEGDEPKYPFSLSISLDDEQIEKLDLEDGEVGEFLHAAVLMKLTGLHKTDTQEGSRKCMNLQICFMKILGDEDEESEEAFERPTSKDLYGE